MTKSKASRKGRGSEKAISLSSGHDTGDTTESKDTTSPSEDRSDKFSGNSKPLSTTAKDFPERARENGILNRSESAQPTNAMDLRERLNRPRASASPSESAFRDYTFAIEDATNEVSMFSAFEKHIMKNFPATTKVKRVLNSPFSALPQNIGFNDGLAPPQPGCLEGLSKNAFKPFPVDSLGGSAAVFKENPSSITLSHRSQVGREPARGQATGLVRWSCPSIWQGSRPCRH